MSLLWPEAYTAMLGPASVGLYRSRDRQWLGSAEFAGGAGLSWPAALEALEPLLAQRAPGRASLRVLLSSHYTRFCLVPWSESIGSPEELDGYARLCLEDIYGDAGEGWSLRLSPEAAGCPRLAVALPEELLGRLRSLAQSAKLRMNSVQPYLMAAFNRHRKTLSGADFLFLVAEPGRGSLLQARDGCWVAVRSVALEASDAALAALIAREGELLSLEERAPEGFFLHAPGHRGESHAGLARLDGELPAGAIGEPLYAMALAVN